MSTNDSLQGVSQRSAAAPRWLDGLSWSLLWVAVCVWISWPLLHAWPVHAPRLVLVWLLAAMTLIWAWRGKRPIAVVCLMVPLTWLVSRVVGLSSGWLTL